MNKLLCCAVLALSLSAARGGEPKWIRMPSSDFEIYSSAGEGDTRRVLQALERVRNFFEQTIGSKGQKREPVHVIVFGSKKEYEAYRPVEFAAAFYTQVAGRDYIVLGSANDIVFPVAVHEYVHLVAQNDGLKLPPWLNEGLAELFSTLQPSRDNVLVGAVIPGRIQGLLQEKWVPLADIVSAGHDSPYYNEKNKAGSLYNEGWALTHMLELSREYRPRVATLVDEIQKGTPSRQAIEQVYGKPLEAVDKELQAYVRSDRFLAVLFPLKLDNAEKVAAEPAPMFDVKLALLDLANRPGREAEAGERLQELIKDDPKRPEPYVGLGYLEARTGRQEEALKSFESAIERGSRSPQMLWDYGRMAGQSHPEQAIAALTTLLADQPGRIDVRLVLGQIQMSRKLFQDAIATVGPIKKVTPEDAPRLFQMLAYANMETGNRALARLNAQRWLENTKDEGEKDSANRMLRYLDQQDAMSKRAAQPVSPAPAPPPQLRNDDSDSRPQIKRAEAEPEPLPNPLAPNSLAQAPLDLPSVSGTLLELDCKGPKPKFVIQTGSGRVSVLMDDPKNVWIRGRADGFVDLNCGPQKQVAVRMQYDKSAAAQAGVIGVLRVLHFEPDAGKLPESGKLKER